MCAPSLYLQGLLELFLKWTEEQQAAGRIMFEMKAREERGHEKDLQILHMPVTPELAATVLGDDKGQRDEDYIRP